MSYYASAEATFHIKEGADFDKLKDILEDQFEILDYDKTTISAWTDGNYREDLLKHMLEMAKPYLDTYHVDYLGEDGSRWRFSERGEEEASTVYKDTARTNLENSGFSERQIDKIMKLLAADHVLSRKELVASSRIDGESYLKQPSNPKLDEADYRSYAYKESLEDMRDAVGQMMHAQCHSPASLGSDLTMVKHAINRSVKKLGEEFMKAQKANEPSASR